VCVCVYVCSKFYNVKKFQTLFCFKSSAKCRKFEVLNIKSASCAVGELFSDKKISKHTTNFVKQIKLSLNHLLNIFHSILRWHPSSNVRCQVNGR